MFVIFCTQKSEAPDSSVYPVAHLNVSSDVLLSLFPTGPADSHLAGNAADSSTELPDTKWK